MSMQRIPFWRCVTAITVLVNLLSAGWMPPPAQAGPAAALAIAAFTPTGAGAPLASRIQVTFDQPINPATFSGSINGAAIVPTQIVFDAANVVVTVDPGELEYSRAYQVIISGAVQNAAGDGSLGGDQTFTFIVQDNPTPKRPTTTLNVPAGPFEAGQIYTLSGQAAGFVWQRDANNPLALRHWDVNGNDTGGAPMLHPAALYFPNGMDGYKYWLFYTPYPGAIDENPVVMRSNDGVTFTAAGIPANPLFTYNYQPPFDMQNLADPEAYYLGQTWMLFYEMETPSLGEWMKTGGNIGVAFSDDGKTWMPYGGPYTYDPANPPAGFPPNGNPVVVPDISEPSDYRSGEMAVLFKDGLYHMWRTVIGGGLNIGYDTATDPRGPWTKHDSAVSFAGYSLGPHPDVVYDAERGVYVMVYLTPIGADVGQLGIYTATDPAGPWTAHPLNPVFRAQGGWEGSTLYRASLAKVDGQWFMYYSGDAYGAAGGPRIGLAREVPGVRRVEVSINGGTTWQPASVNPDGSWNFNWTPPNNGAYTLMARATDDFMSGAATTGVNVNVGQATLPTPASPLLLITNGAYTANLYGRYLAEILRSEGLVEFQQVELSALMADANPLAYLNAFKVALLAETSLTATEEQLMRDYVSGGGSLIAMRPDTGLADLFGLTYVNARSEQLLEFFAIDTATEAGAGLVNVSLQYHGEADNYALNGATALANLWNSISAPSSNPAVAFHTYGNGQTAAFTFDLAKSIVLTRQGNPAWKDSEGDGLTGYRPEDLFFRTNGDKWLAPERTRIPQADEAQRFLANLILTMSDQPLPRLWYLPDKHKSLMVNTGDAEGAGGSSLEPIMNDLASYGGRFTNYMMEGGIAATSAATEALWRAAGHETGPHVYGASETCPDLRVAYQNIVNSLQAQFGHGARTARSHTIDWCGWVDMAAIEGEFGTGLDTNYYHYLPPLLAYGDNANGYFTASGLPQKFMDETGALLPIYQAATQWPDEWFADNGFTANQTTQIIESMFTAAENGYYSAFVANTHHVRYDGSDPITRVWANAIWAYARDHNIPLWSAEMLLDFVEARNAGQFNNLNWNGTTLSFDFATTHSGQDLTLMVPARVGGSDLLSITVDGVPATFTTEAIKGRDYALFVTRALAAQVVASYGQDTTPPALSNIRAEAITEASASIAWNTDEPATSRVDYGLAPDNLIYSQTSAAFVTARSLALGSLTPNTTYHYRVTSVDRAGNTTASDVSAFTTSLPRWVETTAADFNDGALSDIIVNSDGSFNLGLATGFFDHFEGTTLDTGKWLARNIAGNPINVTVADSAVTVADVTYIRTNQTWFQETVEGLVTLGSGPNAHFGWANTVQAGDDGIGEPHWMIFTSTNGQIWARTRFTDGQGNGGEVNTPLAGVLPGVPHLFKIVWNADNTIEFWVDGYRQTTHTRAFAEPLRVYLTSNTGQTGSAAWISVSGAYAISGTYESSIFNAAGNANYDVLTWQGNTPAGTAIAFETRASADNVIWSTWEALGAGGSIASPDGQYFQYRATLTTSSANATPRVDEVVVTYQPGPDTTPPTLVSTSPAEGAVGMPVEGDIVIHYNEPINPTTFSATIGGVTFATSFSNNYRTVTLNPDANLNFLTAYTVSIAADVQDTAGNAITAPHSFSFTTTEQILHWIETTTADFGDGVLNNTQVINVGDGALSLSQAGFFDHFDSATLDPAKWIAGDWGGSAPDIQMAGSAVTINALDFIKSVPTFNQSKAEGMVRFGINGSYLNFAVATGLNAPCTYMTIGPDAVNTMRVQTYDSHDDGAGLVTDTALTTYLPAFNALVGDGQFHYVKIEWTGAQVRYFIDDPNTPVATHTNFGRPLNGNYNLWLSSAGQPFSADWLSAAEYTASGTYESSVFNSGGSSQFRALTWTGAQPAGGSVAFETRTSLDGINWSNWEAVGAGGGLVSPAGQSLQYRLTLATSNPSAAPVIESVDLAYVPGEDMTPPIIVSTVPANQAIDISSSDNITVTYNEAINPATFQAALNGGAPFNATFQNGNRTVVIDPDADLAFQTEYTVTIAAGVQDGAGNPTAAPYVFHFTTAEYYLSWVETTVADFSDGDMHSTQVTSVGDGEVALAFGNFNDTFTQPDGPALNWELWPASGDLTKTATWQVLGGALVHDLNDAIPTYHPAMLSTAYTPSGDFTLEARQRLTQISTGGGDLGVLGLVVGAQSTENYYFLQYAATSLGVKIYKRNPGGGFTAIGSASLADPVVGQWYTLRVEMVGTMFNFYVDGVLRLTAADPTYLPGRIGLLGYEGSRSEYDDVVASSQAYAVSGTYTSHAFDAGGRAAVRKLTWVGQTPAGTSATFQIRSALTLSGLTSAMWMTPAGDGTVAGVEGRFLQYRATLATANLLQAPSVQQVEVRYVPLPPDTTPPSVTTASPSGLDVPRDANLVITFDEVIDPASFAATLNGAPVLPAEISFAEVSGHSVVTLNPATDLDGATMYWASIAQTVTDLSGNPLGAPYIWNFTTAAQQGGWVQTTIADFESGSLNGLMVTEDGNGELRLPSVFYDRFLGSTLDARWTSAIWSGAAYSPAIADGVLTHSNPGGGAYVHSVQTFQPSLTVQARLKFNKGGNATAPYLYFGLAGNGLVPWALFGTGYDGTQLYTSVYPNSGPYTFGLGSDLFDQWHDYKIVWNAASVEFWVDGVLRRTEALAVPGPLNVYFSASGGTPSGASVSADWVRVETYALSLSETSVERLNDTFAEADGPAVNWVSLDNPQPSSGDWAVVDHTYRHGPAGVSYHPAVLNSNFPPYTNYDFETRAMSPDGAGFFGLAWGVQDNAHYYFAQFYPGQGMRVYRLDNWFTSFAQIADVPTSPAPVTGQWFTLRLEARDGVYRLYVDGALQATIADAKYATGRVGVIGYGGNTSYYDDVILREYGPGPGVSTSPVFDAGAPVTWEALTWMGSAPAGTSVTFETRSGDTPAPDGTWSAWAAVNSPIASPASRYLQYRVSLMTSDLALSPAVESVAVSYRTASSTVIQIPLSTGWNLVSIPVMRSAITLTQVLYSIEGDYDLVYAYDGCGAGWRKHDAHALPYANTLTTLDHTQGFWIRVSAPVTLTVQGALPEATPLPLCAGWNLVGYPSLTERPLPEALSGVPFNLMYAYAPESNWQKYDATALPYVNSLTALTRLRGYWVRVSATAVWTVLN